jgi:CHASE1-domain containing sensor protein
LEPRDKRNQAAIGFNMFSEPTRRAAMEKARDKGDAVISSKVLLKQEITQNKQWGFLIYVPIYRGPRAPGSVEERRARLLGFVYSPFRAGDFFQTLLEAV